MQSSMIPVIKILFIRKLYVNIGKRAGQMVAAARVPTSVDLSLKSDGKHPAAYVLNKEYCSEDGKLFDILVSED